MANPNRIGRLRFGNNSTTTAKDNLGGGTPFSFGEALAVGLPLFSFFDNKATSDRLLEQGIDVKFPDVNPAVPVVRSAKNPNFTTKTRLPGGSSLAERENSLRFAEAQTDARKQQFNQFNDQFIQDQVRQNSAVTNQARFINNRNRSIENQINTQTRIGRIGAAQNQANASIEALLQNTVNIGNQRTMANAATDADLFRAVVESGKLQGAEITNLLKNLKGKKFAKRYDEIVGSSN